MREDWCGTDIEVDDEALCVEDLEAHDGDPCLCVGEPDEEPSEAEPIIFEGVRYESPHSLMGVLLEELKGLPPSATRAMEQALASAGMPRSPEEIRRVLLAAGFTQPEIEAQEQRLRVKMALHEIAGKIDPIQIMTRLMSGEPELDSEAIRNHMLQQGLSPELVSQELDGFLLKFERQKQIMSPPPGSYLVARNAVSGQLLWRQQVSDQGQITRMEMRQGKLWLRDSLLREYEFDLATRNCRPLVTVASQLAELLHQSKPIDALLWRPEGGHPAWYEAAELLKQHQCAYLSLGQQLTLYQHTQCWPQAWGVARTLMELGAFDSNKPWLTEYLEKARAGCAAPDLAHEAPARDFLNQNPDLRPMLAELYQGLNPSLDTQTQQSLERLLQRLAGPASDSAVLAAAHTVGQEIAQQGTLEQPNQPRREIYGRLRAWVVKLACLLGPPA